MTAARWPPRSDPQSSHALRPSGMQRALGGIVRETNPAIVEEPSERIPELENIEAVLGEIMAAR